MGRTLPEDRLDTEALSMRKPVAINPSIKDNKAIRGDVLISICKRFDLKLLCEVGVKSGGLTGYLAEHLPECRITAVDPWRFYPDWPSWDNDKHLRHERQFDRVAERFPGRIGKMKMPSVEAATHFPDGSLDLVFIDGDHSYEAVRADIAAWKPKVRHGGVLSGHDYNNTAKYGAYFKGVDKAVEEAFPAFNVEPDSVWWVRL
jgi:hypothetical protein